MPPILVIIFILLLVAIVSASVHYILTDRNWRLSIAIGLSVAAGIAVYHWLT